MKDDLKDRYKREMNKDFRIKLYPIENEDSSIEWAAEIPELPGCVGGGDTPQEALAEVEDAKKAWIEVALGDGKKVPEPKSFGDNALSGKFTLRLPKSLHRDLAEEADEENISLNQYILFLIAKHHYEVR